MRTGCGNVIKELLRGKKSEREERREKEKSERKKG